MAGTSGGGIPGSLMFTAGFDFSKAETKAIADVDKIIDNLQKKLEKKKLTVKLDFEKIGDFGKLTSDIKNIVEEIKKAKAEFSKLSSTTPTGGGVGTSSDLDKTAKQIELLTLRLNEYIAKLNEVATKKKSTSSVSTSADEKAIAKAQEKVRILNAEENSIGAVQAKLKLYNQQLARAAEGSKAWDYTTAQIQRLNSTLDQLKAKAKEATMSDAEQERILLKEIEKEEKARARQLAAREKLVQKGQQLVRALQAEETSLNAVATKIKMYQGLLQRSAEGSNAWKNAVAQIRRLGAAYDDLKMKMQLALVTAVNSINNLNSQLGIYTGRLNSLEIGSSQWKTMALRIREVSTELAKAQQHLADFQAKAFQGLSGNFTKNQVAEVQRLRTEIASMDAQINNLYQRALNTGTPDAMRIAMVDINRKLDERIKKEEQINKILTSSADLQLKRQKELTAEIEKQKKIAAQRAEGARRVAILKGEEKSIAGINAKLQIYNELLRKAKPNTAGFDYLIQQVDRLTSKLSIAQQRIDAMTGKAAQNAIKVNKALNTQLSYIERLIRRMALYASIGAIGGFLTKIREVTAEFELQRISLGAIIQDQAKANQLFEEIKTFALKSPVKILDLTKYTKQLAAYRIETDKLFDTTKRLADVSVGVGVSMDRLILAYGQIRATGYLRASEVRQLTEAGIPIIEELARKLSDVNGELVRAKDVMEMISKREVPFEMVAEVFEDMTNKGGVFYDMQEKQGNTLYGMWQKLGDAVAMMYDEIGNTTFVNQGMKATISMLRSLMLHWKQLAVILAGSVVMLGTWFVQSRKQAFLIKKNTAEYQLYLRQLEREVLLKQQQLALTGKGITKTKILTRASLAQARAQLAAANATNMFARGWHNLRAAVLAHPFMAAAVAIGVIVGLFMTWTNEASKLQRKLEEIDLDYVDKSKELKDNFFELADKALGAPTGSKRQKDALDELRRSYGEIFNAEDLEISNLQKLRDNYDQTAAAIDAYNEKRRFEERETAIKSSYEKQIKDAKEDLEDYMRTYGLSEAKISEFFAKFNQDLSDGLDAEMAFAKNWKEIVEDNLSALTSLGTAINIFNWQQMSSAWSTLGNELSFKGSDIIWGYVDAIKAQNEALAENDRLSKEVASGLGSYLEEIEDLFKALDGADYSSWAAYVDSLEKMFGNDSDTWVQIAGLLNGKGLDLGKGENALENAMIENNVKIRKLLGETKKILEDNDAGELYTRVIDGILADTDRLAYLGEDIWEFILMGVKNQNSRNAIKEIQKYYLEIAPQDSVVQQIRNKLYEVTDAYGANADKMKLLLMGESDNVDEYLKRLQEQIESYKKKLKAMETAVMRKGFLGAIAQLAYGKQIEDTRKMIEALEELEEYTKEYTIPKDDKNKKSDPRLQILNNIASTMDKINKEYDDLLKKEGETKALADTQELFAEELANLQKIASKHGFKLPAFEVPKNAQDVKKWYNAVANEIRRLKLKDADRILIDLGYKANKVEKDELQKEIELRLKELSEKISASKTAREFYDKILSQTGDVDIAAQVTMSIYGDTGEGLQRAMAEQIRQMFEGYDVEVPVNVIGANDKINYRELEEYVRKMQQALGGVESSTYQELLKIAKQGQKDWAKTYEGYLKDLEKAKSYSEKRIELARKTAQTISDIMTDANMPQSEKDRLIAGYNEKEAKEAAKLEWEAFKDTPMYVQMFADLEYASTSALESMQTMLLKLRGAWGENLDPTQLKEMQSRLTEISKQLASRNPSKGLKEASKELRKLNIDYGSQAIVVKKLADATARLIKQRALLNDLLAQEEQAKEKMEFDKDRYGSQSAEYQTSKALYEKAKERTNAEKEVVDATEKELTNLESINGQYNEQKQNIAESINAIKEYISKTKELFDTTRACVEEWSALGDNELWGAIMDGLDTFVSATDKTLDMTSTLEQLLRSGAKASTGDIFSMVTAGMSALALLTQGIGQIFYGAKIAKANREIAKQEKLLHSLEYTYDRLEKAQEKLFGTEHIVNYRQQIANLQAQAEAYRKQAEAERSKGKKADKDAIQDYEDSYKEAMDEIQDRAKELQEYLLGSDITSAARDWANAWLEARWAFEDTTEAMKEKFADMVQNMIVESMAAKLMEDLLTPIYDEIDKATKDNQVTADEIARIAELGYTAIGQANIAMEGLLTQLQAAGLDLQEMFGEQTELTGISRDIATASEESINGLAQGINTQNYYISHVPTISENVAAIRLLMEGGTMPQIGAGADLMTLQNEHLAQLPVIAANTLATAERCERAAIACEEMRDAIARVVTAKGNKMVINTALN